jgi:hypothetical protein
MPVLIENSASLSEDSISDLTAFLEVKTTEKKPIKMATNKRRLTIKINLSLRLISQFYSRQKKRANALFLFEVIRDC